MINKSEELKSVIQKLIKLFKEQNYKNWEEEYTKILFYIDDDLEYAKYKIRRTFGGMGSMNDIILYDNGNLLIEENRFLDELRYQLFELC
ncbi:DUF6966 domain-containing protein [Acinetobacter portensis]|uniref:DUF6966 domain-containing protein n=1 Tax=Acinetobacter portensis TaxID=1839785 RepID=UPI0013D0543B|nr:hypothetical protein [Acinetobacter portensis]